MRVKDIYVGEYYILKSDKKSKVGCSFRYFKEFQNTQVLVLNKLNAFNNRNTVRIQGLSENNGKFELVSFWVSPYDLTRKPCDT